MSEDSCWPGLSPASLIDHTLLKPETMSAEIALLCEEAVEAGFASVCVPPRFVPQAAQLLYGSEVRVGTVVGFPLGYATAQVKTVEAEAAAAAGADELDMVIPFGPVREQNYQAVTDEVRAVVQAVPGRTVKVILECCLWSLEQKRRLVEAVVAGGAHYVKTSTGFSASGATLDDVALLKAVAAGRARVKAAGGIRDWPTMRAMLAAGADRIGTSSGMAILQQWSMQDGPA